MKNYLNMLLNESRDLQATLDKLTSDFQKSNPVRLEEKKLIRGYHCLGGEFITHSRLEFKDDPAKIHSILTCYRHLAKLKFDDFVKQLAGLYGGNVKNIPASIIYEEDKMIDLYSDYCTRLIIGDLSRHVMTREMFLKLYGEDQQSEVSIIDKVFVCMEFFLFDASKDSADEDLPHLASMVQVGKWVNTNSRSVMFMRENIENRYFKDGVETSSPIE